MNGLLIIPSRGNRNMEPPYVGCYDLKKAIRVYEQAAKSF